MDDIKVNKQIVATVDGMINDTVKFVNESITRCSVFVDQNQTIDVDCKDVGGCDNVTISGNNFDQYVNINVSCLANDFSQNVSDFKSIANNSSQNIIKLVKVFAPGETDSVIKLCQNIVQSVTNSYIHECNADLIDSQYVNVIKRKAKNVIIRYVNKDQYINLSSTCATQSKSVTDLKQQLYQLLKIPDDIIHGNGGGGGGGGDNKNPTDNNNDDNDTNKYLKYFQLYGGFIGIGVVMVITLLLSGFQYLINLLFWLFFVFITGVYLIVLYIDGSNMWPYNNNDDDDSLSTNKIIFMVSLISTIVSLILFFIMIFVRSRNTNNYKPVFDNNYVNINSPQ